MSRRIMNHHITNISPRSNVLITKYYSHPFLLLSAKKRNANLSNRSHSSQKSSTNETKKCELEGRVAVRPVETIHRNVRGQLEGPNLFNPFESHTTEKLHLEATFEQETKSQTHEIKISHKFHLLQTSNLFFFNQTKNTLLN